MPDTTDKDREDEAREFASLIYENYGHGKNDAHDRILERDARIRAKALREAAERLCHACIAWDNGCQLELTPCKDRSAILSANPSTDEGEARECVWTEDTDGLWETSCGRSWTFIEGGPEANRVNYCHGCGKPVRITDEPDKEE